VFKKKKNKDTLKVDERKYPRYDFFQHAYYRIVEENDTDAEECWVNNISLGGLCIEIGSNILSEGDTIKVVYKVITSFRKDELKVMYMKKVINNWRYGCLFIHDDEKRDRIIAKYIEKTYFNKKM
jgi:hypothetical protein